MIRTYFTSKSEIINTKYWIFAENEMKLAESAMFLNSVFDILNDSFCKSIALQILYCITDKIFNVDLK